MELKLPDHLIIFDGVCNFCDTSVQVILKNDVKQQFFFTANQSEAGQKILEKYGVETHEVGTIYYLSEGKLFDKSTAALQIARRLRFPFYLLYYFIFIPKFLRDGVYDFIARNRYRWFGKKSACRIPSPEERGRFLEESVSVL